MEEKLRNVKEGLIEKLSQRELEERQYFQTVYQLLHDEGIVKGAYKNSTIQVVATVAVGLRGKLPAEQHWGLEKRYVALEGRELSTEVQEDLRKYSELEANTNDYLRTKIGNQPIFKSKFERMVEDYLMSQTELSNMTSKDNQREAVIRITINLDKKFKVQEDPKKIGKYDIQSIESALDKL
ncbi:MAG: hypothetical protein KAU20_00120 [Nanoarchaeota archaeon]|nr:hypothetical protein [Nanoarchaeota archaeon]